MKNISRRDFLKIVGAGAAALALKPGSIFADNEVNNGPLIAVARGDRNKLVKGAVDALGGIESFIKTGDTVCVKPNISFAANIESGATTSPEIVRQIVELCLDAGAKKITILDHTIANPELCVSRSRIKEAVVDDKKVALVTLNQENLYTEIKIPGGSELETILVAKATLDCDKLINVPTAKSHSATGVSLGLKNLMGLVWDRGQLHNRDLNVAIAELALVIKPDLTILDATRALVSGGPGGPGKTVQLDAVVAGIDPVAVDSCAVELTPWYDRSFTGRKVKHILAASELGIGEIDISKMNIKQVQV